ncbi:hypothetical protein GUJ93_ZPchr0015g6945 [Zizania palustris]|uniref:Uncharacterized protein n=1 Tax=Zizania palustris TaxID=103762 RepID=A0A8J5TM16_ZIZPA|nr:hypothetical protein GUJ93_ZPchr0015g6945 [Zizania palustris]
MGRPDSAALSARQSLTARVPESILVNSLVGLLLLLAHPRLDAPSLGFRAPARRTLAIGFRAPSRCTLTRVLSSASTHPHSGSELRLDAPSLRFQAPARRTLAIGFRAPARRDLTQVSSSGSTHPRNRVPSSASTHPHSGSELRLDAPSQLTSEPRHDAPSLGFRAPARRTLAIGFRAPPRRTLTRVPSSGSTHPRNWLPCPGSTRPHSGSELWLDAPSQSGSELRLDAPSLGKREPGFLKVPENSVGGHPSGHLTILRHGKVYLPGGGLDKLYPVDQGLPGDVERAAPGAIARQHPPDGHRGVSRRLLRLDKRLGYLPVPSSKVHLGLLQLGHSRPKGHGVSCRLQEFFHLRDLSLECGNLSFEPLRFCGSAPKPLCLGSSGPKGVDFRLQLVRSRGLSPKPFQLCDAGLEGVHLHCPGLERFDPSGLEPKSFDLHCLLVGQPLNGVRSCCKPRIICFSALALGEQGKQRTLRQRDHLHARN